MLDVVSPVPAPMEGVLGLVVKNLVALAHGRGLEFVRRKRRGSARISRSLIKPSRNEPVVRGAAIASDASGYFSVDVEARPGINHLRFALELLVREAVSMGRTPVAFKPRFDPRHNLGHDLDADWDRYIDLNHVELVERATGAVMAIRMLRRADLGPVEPLAALWVEREHAFTERECRDHDLVVRHNKTGLHIPAVHDGVAGLPQYVVRFRPSDQIHRLAQAVQRQLGHYCGVHVRRDDMLEMKDVYPNLDRDTQPGRMGDTLAKVVDEGSTVYILTNERNKTFFAPLKSRFRILQYFDFPELAALVDGPRPDNFLLFEVEKLLFEQSHVKVHTFSHPDGGQRIALCSDKGWA